MNTVDKEYKSNTVFTSREILDRAVMAVKQNKDTDIELFDIVEKNLINATSKNGVEMAMKDIEQLINERVNKLSNQCCSKPSN